MTTAPAFGLLLDVDGPIASPVTRTISIPSIADDLVALANAGIPIVFNTGRSDAFLTERVFPQLVERGIAADARVVAICEKGAVWFTVDERGSSEPVVDTELAVPAAVGQDIERLVDEKYADLVFFDHTKRAMVSIEQHLDVPSDVYLARQDAFDAEALAIMLAHGLGVERRGERHPDAAGGVAFRIDPTVISTDIESNVLGKDLGARRAIDLLAETGGVPNRWRTVGDSRSDYAMADWLHEHGYEVAHVDVRPAEGVPAKPYPVLVAGELIHDDAGAVFLDRWRQQALDPSVVEEESGISRVV